MVGCRNGDGMVTAELAVALPVLFVLLATAIGMLQAVGAELRCADAARLVARAAARGDSITAATAQARAAAPQGAQVSVRRSGDTYVVAVNDAVGVPGPWFGRGPHWSVSATVRAPAEPDSVGTP
jgi:Flp pilus assembly protein TadG